MSGMTTAGYIALASATASTAVSIMGQQQQASAAKKSAAYQAAVARNNQILAQRQADDARARGAEEAARSAEATKKLEGRQRAVLAANGVDVNAGTSLDILGDTAKQGKYDELTIRANAERQAAGYEAQGMNYAGEADFALLRGDQAASAANTASAGALLGGVGTVAEKWYKFTK